MEKRCLELELEKEALLTRLQTLAELHRNDMQEIRNEYIGQIDLLKANNAILRGKILQQDETT